MSEQAGNKSDGFTLSPKVRQYLAMAVGEYSVLCLTTGARAHPHQHGGTERFPVGHELMDA